MRVRRAELATLAVVLNQLVAGRKPRLVEQDGPIRKDPSIGEQDRFTRTLRGVLQRDAVGKLAELAPIDSRSEQYVSRRESLVKLQMLPHAMRSSLICAALAQCSMTWK